ncbi:hypothetical protein [Actinomadura litoris]|uniref:hypothetical protein n=1 Tax=Actinomadura litoris TaxID=2678616 RepID=UPI001FA6FF45|nr:hypothetical protein [Actinomadura litoris]
MSDHDREVQLLRELREPLFALGLSIQLQDSLPGLDIATTSPEQFIWASGRTFTWRRDDSKHPVEDMPGAAAQIARFVSAQGGQLNGSTNGHLD